MARSRVASFMSHFSSNSRNVTPIGQHNATQPSPDGHSQPSQSNFDSSTTRESPPPPRQRTDRPPSRPTSMIQPYNPPLMEVAQDTLPELQPIFSFLNSHSNKLYQEGYFLKLNDLDSYGRPTNDRNWTECFAQLVGTVLSLWDASSLDVVGQDGEVVPTFINLTDASIKMLDTLPTRNKNVQPLQNVLSVSTAGKNRYLFHFNSHHSLTQWTAGIRLAMYEHATLQEAYTGSLIAGKGRTLNNINLIMERNKFKVEDWARVRFGAGVPWRRCWYVISPPDEKAIKQQQKNFKKKSAYDRQMPVLKGDIKFYDSKKTKKSQPIATITDAFSAYAIYPQSKPLIDQSTLVKVEGTVTIHSKPPTSTEGFVFVMPELHAAVSGFEIMLRWLFPVFDTFALYGRPNRLIADTLDQRGLMFAMPNDRHYGFLEILDVAGLIHADGSPDWREAQWRKQMKDLTGKRMATLQASGSRSNSRTGRRAARNSLPPTRSGIQFDDAASTRSAQSHQLPLQQPNNLSFTTPPRVDSAPATQPPFAPPHTHHRSVSEAQGLDRYQAESIPPAPPAHASNFAAGIGSQSSFNNSSDAITGRSSSESESRPTPGSDNPVKEMVPAKAPEPVASPPAFAHAPGSQPSKRPYHHPELRRAKSRMSTDTLSQLASVNAGNGVAAAGAAAAWKASPDGQRAEGQREPIHQYNGDEGHKGVLPTATGYGAPADRITSQDGTVIPHSDRPRTDHPLPPPPEHSNRGPSPLNQVSVYGQPTPPARDPKSDFVFELPSNTYPPSSEGGQSIEWHTPNTSQPSSPSKQTVQMMGVGTAIGELNNVPPRTDSLRNPQRLSTDKPLPPLQTDSSIQRKPLPAQPPSQLVETPQVASSGGSLAKHVVDQAALDRVMTRGATQSSDGERPRLGRQGTDASSVYDDESTGTPDYASTRKSTDTKRSAKSVERPRAGVMKTVGHVETVEPEVVIGDTHYRSKSQSEQQASTIPAIDFGPTMNYAAGQHGSRPGTSGTLTANYPDYTGSKTPPNGLNSAGYSPQHSPGNALNRDSYHFPDSRPNRSPNQEHVRSGSGVSGNERPRSMAWQPGMGSAGGQQFAERALTPEQFVQQRANQSRVTPVYAHQKRPSTAHRADTPPLGPGGQPYMDPQSQPHSRNSSAELLAGRPHSRGASPSYSPTQADYSARLSAREQEHVARVTGSPLINMAGGPSSRQQTQGGGLIGAIEAREREKKDIKQGISGHMVQHAIQQRQQQAQGYSYGQPQPQQAGQYSSQQYPPQQQQQQPQQAGPIVDSYGRVLPMANMNMGMGFPNPPGQAWNQPGQGRGSPVTEGQGFGFPQQQQQQQYNMSQQQAQQQYPPQQQQQPQQQYGGYYGQAR